MRKPGLLLLAAVPFLSWLCSASPILAQNSDEAELNDMIKAQSAQTSGLTGTGGGAGGLDMKNLGNMGSQLKNMDPAALMNMGSGGLSAGGGSQGSINTTSGALSKLGSGALNQTKGAPSGFSNSGGCNTSAGAQSPGGMALPGLDSVPNDLTKQLIDNSNKSNDQMKQLLDEP